MARKTATLSRKKQPSFEYQILLQDRLVWRGSHPKREYQKLVKKYPDKTVAIRWKGREGILIAQVFLSL